MGTLMGAIVLEGPEGRSLLTVDWRHEWRPTRIVHAGRTYDAARQEASGRWVYRTYQHGRPHPTCEAVFEAGEDAAYRGTAHVPDPPPAVWTFGGIVYTLRRRRGAHGGPLYHHA